MSKWTWICLSLLGGSLAAPYAAAQGLPGTPVRSAEANDRGIAQSAKPQVCFSDVFAGPLPGVADYCLGMLDWNHGHYQSGLELLKLAAAWGNKSAQYTLGLIHYAGHHVPANVALGLAWLMLADERHNDLQIDRAKRSAFKWASAGERDEAGNLYGTMFGKYGDKVAAARAWRRVQHWRRAHDRRNSGCIRVYGPEAVTVRQLGLAGVPPNSIRSLLFDKNGRPRPNQNAGACVTLHMRRGVMRHLSAKYFEGWMGTVSVGPLKTVPAPAESSGH